MAFPLLINDKGTLTTAPGSFAMRTISDQPSAEVRRSGPE
jgi:hypothetical protein